MKTSLLEPEKLRAHFERRLLHLAATAPPKIETAWSLRHNSKVRAVLQLREEILGISRDAPANAPIPTDLPAPECAQPPEENNIHGVVKMVDTPMKTNFGDVSEMVIGIDTARPDSDHSAVVCYRAIPGSLEIVGTVTNVDAEGLLAVLRMQTPLAIEITPVIENKEQTEDKEQWQPEKTNLRSNWQRLIKSIRSFLTRPSNRNKPR